MNIVQEILHYAINEFKRHNIETYTVDAELIVSEVIHIEREKIALHLKDKLNSDIVDKCMIMIQKRAQKMPVEYIINKKYFWNSCFYINENVLIPRPDSELLVEVSIEYILQIMKKQSRIRVIEMGVGSGCVILSIIDEILNFRKRESDISNDNIIKSIKYEAKKRNSDVITDIMKSIEYEAVDISEKAIEVAKKNTNTMMLDSYIKLYTSNWWESVEKDKLFSIIISNPPYVSKIEWLELEDNVRLYEPEIAVTDGSDGFKHYHIIISESYGRLVKGGAIILECGYKQAHSVAQILRKYDLMPVKIAKDINNIERVVVGIKP